SWEWVRLGEISKIKSSKRIHLKDYKDNGIPFYRSKEIGNLSRNQNFECKNFISNELYEQIIKTNIPPKKEDLLITAVGSIGNTWINDGRKFYYKDGNITLIEKNINNNTKYIQLYVKSPLFALLVNDTVSGTAYDALTIIKLNNLLLPFPPLEEQERIVEKVEKLQELSKKFKEIYNSNEKTRANLKKAILEEVEKSDTNNELLISLEKLFGNFEKVIKTKEDVKDIRNLVLSLAVRGQLVPQIENEEPASELLQKIKEEKERLVSEKVIKKEKPLPAIIEDEKPFNIPNSWEWVRLGVIGQIIGGGTPKTERTEYWNGSVPWLTPADLNGYKDKYISFGKRFITDLGLKESSAQLLKEGTILFSSRAPIGYVAITKNNLATNQGFKSISLFETKSKEYLYYYLKKIAKTVNDNASGTTFKEISGSDVSKILFSLPPLKEQERIVKRVDELMTVCDTLESKIEIGEKINQKLLASLLKK
ncbi:MAG: restriction endonuclease subunit S, partial [Fusobacteriaceae bacterium]